MKQPITGFVKGPFCSGAIMLYVCFSLMGLMTLLLAQEGSRLVLIASLYDRPIHGPGGERTANLQKALFKARTGLLMFASLQGYSNSSEWGRLPCPDRTGDGVSDSACNSTNTWFGRLPTRHRIARNQWISGLGLEPDALAQLSTGNASLQSLTYAVAPRVTSGEPVQWTSPPPTAGLIHLKNAQGQTITQQAVAVLATGAAIGQSAYEIQTSEPVVWISYTELAAHMQLKARSLFGENVRNFFRSDAARQPALISSSLPATLSTNGAQVMPVASACQCSCTKTRCKCGCAVSAQWISQSNCITGTTGTCLAQNALYVCTAAAGQVCVFGGAAGLSAEWPITKWSPQPVANSSCVSAVTNWMPNRLCPLSSNSSSCNCDFDWALGLQGYALTTLSGYRLSSDRWLIADTSAWSKPAFHDLLEQAGQDRPLPRRPTSTTAALDSLFSMIGPPR